VLHEVVAVLLAGHGHGQHTVVRTELVHGSGRGFDWLDAGAGFAAAVVSAAAVLLVLEVVRTHRSSIGSTSRRTNPPLPAGRQSENRKDVQSS
jgi:hypothetical protein